MLKLFGWQFGWQNWNGISGVQTCHTPLFDLGMPRRNPGNIAERLGATERVALFCAAADIDHAAVGILSSTMRTVEIFGLVARDSHSRRYVLTDTGVDALGVLLERLQRPSVERQRRPGPALRRSRSRALAR